MDYILFNIPHNLYLRMKEMKECHDFVKDMDETAFKEMFVLIFKCVYNENSSQIVNEFIDTYHLSISPLIIEIINNHLRQLIEPYLNNTEYYDMHHFISNINALFKKLLNYHIQFKKMKKNTFRICFNQTNCGGGFFICFCLMF